MITRNSIRARPRPTQMVGPIEPRQPAVPQRSELSVVTIGPRDVGIQVETEIAAAGLCGRLALGRPPLRPVHLRVRREVPLIAMHYPLMSAKVA
jgi:hypothetical protein